MLHSQAVVCWPVNGPINHIVSKKWEHFPFKCLQIWISLTTTKNMYCQKFGSTLCRWFCANPWFLPLCVVFRAVVHIQVDDVNEFAPVFREPQYHAAVTEGKIYDSILQVEATDQDCSPQYSQICNYQITTTNSPFAIDRNGKSNQGCQLAQKKDPISSYISCFRLM